MTWQYIYIYIYKYGAATCMTDGRRTLWDIIFLSVQQVVSEWVSEWNSATKQPRTIHEYVTVTTVLYLWIYSARVHEQREEGTEEGKKEGKGMGRDGYLMTWEKERASEQCRWRNDLSIYIILFSCNPNEQPQRRPTGRQDCVPFCCCRCCQSLMTEGVV